MSVVLLSNDGQEIPVTHASMIDECTTLSNLVEDIDEAGDLIPVPNIDGATLQTIVDFFDARSRVDAKESFETSYLMENIPSPEMFGLLRAANFLASDVLMDALARALARTISGKSREEIRQICGLENDFTPEEEAEIELENAWAFDT